MTNNSEYPQWFHQLWIDDVKCVACGKRITAWTEYFRAVWNPDGLDEQGYNVCVNCRKKCTNPPKPIKQL